MSDRATEGGRAAADGRKAILILGSDFGTIELAKEAHARGLRVIVADLMETSPTKAEADESWLLSTTDYDGLTAGCLAAGVSYVVAGASDFNLGNGRELSKRLGLPCHCPDDAVWANVRNKRAFKDVCREVGAPVARDVEQWQLEDPDASGIEYPVVVKPSDKSGNRGMSFCHDGAQLRAAIAEARSISDAPIIVERMLHGLEFNIQYAVAGDSMSMIYFTSTYHEPGQPSNLYSYKCTGKEYLDQYLREVDGPVKAALHRMGCRGGIAWVDAMRDDDGKFYLLEMGHRFGGVMLYRPYQMASGFNSISWMLDCAMGIDHTQADLPVDLAVNARGCAASYHLFATHGCTVGRVGGLDVLGALEGVFVDMPKREGTTVRENACMGLVGIYGADYGSMCDALRLVNQNLVVKDTQGDDVFVRFDDYEVLRRNYLPFGSVLSGGAPSGGAPAGDSGVPDA